LIPDLYGLKIVFWVGVDELDVWESFVPFLNDFIKEKVIYFSLSKREVTSKGQEDVIAILSVYHCFDNSPEMLHLLFAIVFILFVFWVGLIKYDLIVIVLIEPKSRGPTILALLLCQENRKDIFLAAKVLFRWPPNFHLLFFFYYLQFLVKIDS